MFLTDKVTLMAIPLRRGVLGHVSSCHIIYDRGVTVMCKAMEDMRNEAAREAAREKTLQIANNMLGMKKLTYEDIARATGLSVDEIKELDSKKSA